MRTPSRIARTASAAALLALAAFAIAGPTGSDRRGEPEAVIAAATAPLAHSNSRAGRAIVTASDLKPGDERSGDVTIANRGHRGALYLVGRPDLASGAAARLAERLELTVRDVSGGAPHVVTAAPLASPQCRPLGVYEQNEKRTYRFTVRFPRGDDGDNGLAGAGVTVGYEWLQTAAARAECPREPEDSAPLPQPPAPPAVSSTQPPARPTRPPIRPSGAVLAGDRVEVTLGDVRLAIVPGPYRFSGRGGTARVGIRCLASGTGTCRGRLQLQRWRRGQGKGVAMAVGRFAVREGARRKVAIKLNARARRRIETKGTVPVRAVVTATDADGRPQRVAYEDRLLYRTSKRRGR